MSRSEALELANFICKFGDELVLLDLVEEIVIPGFMGGRIRTFGKTRYLLYQPEVLNLLSDSGPILVIVGRLIKDTVLEREQVFDERQGLIPDNESIRSSPSSIFVLILNDHRLLFLRETAHAPTLSEFQSTIQHVLRERHTEFIKDRTIYRYAEYHSSGESAHLP